MHIAVFGATDKVGKSVVVKLIEQSHTVTAFEHDGNPFINHPSIRIVQGDIGNTDDIRHALEGVDAVMSTMGTWKIGTATAPAMSKVLTEMEERGIWRIIGIVNVVAQVEGDQPTALYKWIYKLYGMIMPKTLRDYEDQIRFLQSSKADWTLIRVPGIRVSGKKGNWKFSLDRPYPWQRVHAEDIAEALVRQLADTHYVDQAPFIKAGK
jgi:putative NADH-flavin reductase